MFFQRDASTCPCDLAWYYCPVLSNVNIDSSSARRTLRQRRVFMAPGHTLSLTRCVTQGQYFWRGPLLKVTLYGAHARPQPSQNKSGSFTQILKGECVVCTWKWMQYHHSRSTRNVQSSLQSTCPADTPTPSAFSNSTMSVTHDIGLEAVGVYPSANDGCRREGGANC